MPVTPEAPNIRVIVRSLGISGAKAGLMESKLWTVDALRKAAGELGLHLPEKMPRKEMIDVVVRAANKRINKPLGDLYNMTAEELAAYLESVGVESEELLDLLRELDLSPRRKEGLKSLIDFTARELSETGRFMRIAGTVPRQGPVD
jgi:hypothetical protein